MSDQVITNGKYVSLTYSILDENGNVLEQNDLPVNYIHGGHTELIGGMDKAVAGRRAGETVEMTISPQDAFGPHDPDLTFTDDIENVPHEFRVLGAEVPMQSESGEVKTFYVTRIEDGRLTVDANHPFAGKTLKVYVNIKEVRDPTPRELSEDAMSSSAPPSLH
jgi:FKBP-type peptidyl-prolyl cis-trans isomerase SlyD